MGTWPQKGSSNREPPVTRPQQAGRTEINRKQRQNREGEEAPDPSRKGKGATDTEEAPEEDRRKRQAQFWEEEGLGTILQERN